MKNNELPTLSYSASLAALPPYLYPKIEEFLSELGISFKLSNHVFNVEFKNQKQYEKVQTLCEKIKQSSCLFEQLDCFPEIDVSDLFILEHYVSIDRLIPFFESFSKKGIDFNFISNPNCWAIDCLSYVGFISDEEKNKQIKKENLMGSLWTKASTILSEDWLLGIGFTHLDYLVRNDLESDEEFSHVVDFLNSFEFRLSELEDELANGLSKGSFLHKKLQLEQDEIAARNSSYLENLSKANAWMKRESKNINKQEDWEGIRLVMEENNFKVYHLLSAKSKDRESAQLKHCVGLGSYDFHSGIYSIRDEDNHSYATIEIDENGEINQIQGFQNESPEDEAFPVIREFCERHLGKTPQELVMIENSGYCGASVRLLFKTIHHDKREFYLPYPSELTSSNLKAFSLDAREISNFPNEYESFLRTLDIPLALQSYLNNYLKKNPLFSYYDKIATLEFPSLLLSNVEAKRVDFFINFSNENKNILRIDSTLSSLISELKNLKEENFSPESKLHLLLQVERAITRHFSRLIDYPLLKNVVLSDLENGLATLKKVIQAKNYLKRSELDQPHYGMENVILTQIKQSAESPLINLLLKLSTFESVLNYKKLEFPSLHYFNRQGKPCLCSASCMSPSKIKEVVTTSRKLNKLKAENFESIEEQALTSFSALNSILSHLEMDLKDWSISALKDESATKIRGLDYLHFQIHQFKNINSKSYSVDKQSLHKKIKKDCQGFKEEAAKLLNLFDGPICKPACDIFGVYNMRHKVGESIECAENIEKIISIIEEIQAINFDVIDLEKELENWLG